MRRTVLCLTAAALLAWASALDRSEAAEDGSPASLIGNGHFEAGAAGWRLHKQDGAEAEWSTGDFASPAGGRAAKVVVSRGGKSNFVQFSRTLPPGALTARKAYLVRFFARAEGVEQLPVRLLGEQKPWPSMGLSASVTVTGQWKEYRLPFRAKANQPAIGRLAFFLGEKPGTVWLDGVEVVPYSRGELSADGPTIEGRAWTAAFTRDGRLARFVHKATSLPLVEAAEDAPAWEATFLDAAGEKSTLCSTDAKDVACRTFEGGCEFTFTHPEATVRCTVRRDAEADLLAFRYDVANRSGKAVLGIRGPILTGPADGIGGDGTDDTVLVPRWDGAVMDDPFARLEARGRYEQQYPGPLSCQVFTYYDGRAGLYLATHDAGGNVKVARLELRLGLELSIDHLGPVLPGKDRQVDYPTVLGAFTGDWHAAAEIYRDWSAGQPWCARKVRTRDDTPEWLRRGAMFMPLDPRWPGEDGARPMSVEDVRQYVRRCAEVVGGPLLVNNRGFERHGMWTGQEYFPPIPSQEVFEGTSRAIRDLGGQGMLMLSGYRWTIRKQDRGENYDSRELFNREVKPFVTHDLAGKGPVLHTGKEDDFRGQEWAQLCRATDFAKKTIVDAAVHGVRGGYVVVHFDQECSGGYYQSLCGSRDHGHAPGPGPWIAAEMADLYRRIREACRPLDADFALSMEEPNELFLPYLNLCQCRPYPIEPGRFSDPAPLTRSVPLFSFLYHEHLIQWAAMYPWQNAGHPTFVVAKGFCAGLMPGVDATVFRSARPGKALQTILANCMAMYLGPAREYLVFGRMLPPVPTDSPMRTFKAKSGRDIPLVPAVFHSVWRLEDGRVGVVLVNPERESHEVSLVLRAMWEDSPGASCRAVTRAGQSPLDGPQPRVTVPPLEMVLVEIVPSPSQPR